MSILSYLKCLWSTHDYKDPCEKLIIGNITSIRCNRCARWSAQEWSYEQQAAELNVLKAQYQHEVLNRIREGYCQHIMGNKSSDCQYCQNMLGNIYEKHELLEKTS